jgi:hypothetical protein
MIASDPSMKRKVALRPTVWIYCGSRKCKSNVRKSISGLNYLHKFHVKFSLGSPHFSLEAPRPAAGIHNPDPFGARGVFEGVSVALQVSGRNDNTTHGVGVKFTVNTSQGEIELFTTLGGMIIVDGQLFGLTSAHALVSEYRQSTANEEASGESDLPNDSDLESEPDSEYESEARNERDSQDSLQRQSMSELGSDWVTGSKPEPEDPEDVLHAGSDTESRSSCGSLQSVHGLPMEWTPIQFPQVLAYLGAGTNSGNWTCPQIAPATADFALLQDVSSHRTSFNRYYDVSEAKYVPITGHLLKQGLCAGDVYILRTSSTIPLYGYMLGGDASVILRGVVMRTKKIQLDSPKRCK